MILHFLTFVVNIYIFWHLQHTLQTMIQHIYSTLPLKCTNIIQFLSWNLQYGARCARMQRNILKERTQLVEVKLANSKWTNHQPHTVWCLGFAVSVVPAWSSLAVLHIIVVFHRKYCDKQAQPEFCHFFPSFLVFLIKFPSFSMPGPFFEAFPNLPVVPVAVRTMISIRSLVPPSWMWDSTGCEYTINSPSILDAGIYWM